MQLRLTFFLKFLLRPELVLMQLRSALLTRTKDFYFFVLFLF